MRWVDSSMSLSKSARRARTLALLALYSQPTVHHVPIIVSCFPILATALLNSMMIPARPPAWLVTTPARLVLHQAPQAAQLVLPLYTARNLALLVFVQMATMMTQLTSFANHVIILVKLALMGRSAPAARLPSFESSMLRLGYAAACSTISRT